MNHVKEQIRCRDAYTMGLTGKGVGVAVLDTGIFPHRDFDDRIIAFADMVNHRAGPYDDCGHGSHICGIIGGSGLVSDGRYQGMAPGCSLVALKVLDKKGNGYVADVLAGISWILERKEELGVRILNISVGAGGKRSMGENSALVRGVNRAWDEGLVVVVAAGNNGPRRMSITTPGISRKVITVGCSDDNREVLVGTNRMVDYSGRGPTSACICKPDVVAPGCSVVSCGYQEGKYAIKSGTSMSTPIVSGAIALLLEKYPEMTNRDVKLKLMESSRDIGLPRNQQGWGLLDVEKLLL
ncbi:MAG: S8 family peptidase [Lachnospiraceae bacterium]|nr:S8 family peptidase [Lachnospiraceae bacterium]